MCFLGIVITGIDNKENNNMVSTVAPLRRTAKSTIESVSEIIRFYGYSRSETLKAADQLLKTLEYDDENTLYAFPMNNLIASEMIILAHRVDVGCENSKRALGSIIAGVVWQINR